MLLYDVTPELVMRVTANIERDGNAIRAIVVERPGWFDILVGRRASEYVVYDAPSGWFRFGINGQPRRITSRRVLRVLFDEKQKHGLREDFARSRELILRRSP